MKKEITAESAAEAKQGILFPEMAQITEEPEKQKSGKKKRAKKRRGKPDTEMEKMSPKEFTEFLRNRDKERYEKAKLILQEEKDK
ncbi:MAG TPA: hypothetical protein VHO84_08450 [Syntrophorhabdaceae bacterium]|nr:hypothetical protein [Syntrophorhabdaceae bacterium]